MEQISGRDFSSISPSAKWLIAMKGHTDIPFAKEAATLLKYPDEFVPDFKKRDLTFWARTVHFESRYKSIDKLLEGVNIQNILELSSGYSFRSLVYTKNKETHYIDTDLPDVITAKNNFINSLKSNGAVVNGKLELLPLNALDTDKFKETVNHFSPGEIVIINEGLLMYFDKNEKEKLCSIIHNILKERGGYWITADIYLKFKKRLPKFNLALDNKTKEFFEQQNIDNNRFESFKQAEQFFNDMGFVIDKKAKIKYSQLSSFKYLMKSLTLKNLFNFRKGGKIQTTWRLKVKCLEHG